MIESHRVFHKYYCFQRCLFSHSNYYSKYLCVNVYITPWFVCDVADRFWFLWLPFFGEESREHFCDSSYTAQVTYLIGNNNELSDIFHKSLRLLLRLLLMWNVKRLSCHGEKYIGLRSPVLLRTLLQYGTFEVLPDKHQLI